MGITYRIEPVDALSFDYLREEDTGHIFFQTQAFSKDPEVDYEVPVPPLEGASGGEIYGIIFDKEGNQIGTSFQFSATTGPEPAGGIFTYVLDLADWQLEAGELYYLLMYLCIDGEETPVAYKSCPFWVHDFSLETINRTVTSIKESLIEIQGLNMANSEIIRISYDPVWHKLTEATLNIYSEPQLETIIFTYQIEATYDGAGKLKTYKMYRTYPEP